MEIIDLELKDVGEITGAVKILKVINMAIPQMRRNAKRNLGTSEGIRLVAVATTGLQQKLEEQREELLKEVKDGS